MGNKKYFKRGELTAKETETSDTSGNKKVPESKAVNTSSADSLQNTVEHQKLSRPEVIRRLRERGEPISLFGESELEAFQRLRKREILEPEVNKGFRNDFQEAMDQVDQAYLNELLSSSKPSDSNRKVDDNVIPEVEITYEDIEKMSGKLNRGDRDFDMKLITQFLTFLVQMWGNHLNSQLTIEKTSTKGKMASATYAQTREYLKPLMRKLKNKSLPEDITDSLTEIVKHLLERNYILVSIIFSCKSH